MTAENSTSVKECISQLEYIGTHWHRELRSESAVNIGIWKCGKCDMEQEKQSPWKWSGMGLLNIFWPYYDLGKRHQACRNLYFSYCRQLPVVGFVNADKLRCFIGTNTGADWARSRYQQLWGLSTSWSTPIYSPSFPRKELLTSRL